jgi:hypothetical protein
MFKVCAIMAIYNEEDIVRETVVKLISTGIDVYIIDNGSTDDSIKKIQDLVGKGVIDIETYLSYENGREVYNWANLLKKKENISLKLDYDWYLHVDADEIRYSPWEELTLFEGIERVNHEGFNLINFKLFNFRITNDLKIEEDFESGMNLYSPNEGVLDSHQIKAWKKDHSVNIHKHGGHVIERNNPLLYPIKFIHKHYPIRSISQGVRKIQKERADRFCNDERLKGWHVQYDDVNLDSLSGIIWRKEELKQFDFIKEVNDIFRESLSLSNGINLMYQMSHINLFNDLLKKYLEVHAGMDLQEINKMIELAEKIYLLMGSVYLPPIKMSNYEKEIITKILNLYASRDYLNSNPFKLNALKKLSLMTDLG